MIEVVCFIAALIFFLLAMFRVGAPKIDFLPLGLVCFTIPFLIQALDAV